MPIPIPLICERCRAEGVAGEELFERYADLLDFTPVPRRPRADGWDGEVQRAFIVALAATGSPRQAAAAAGKAQFGFDQMKRVKGNESFMAAVDRAMAVHAEEKSRRLGEGVAAVAGPSARWQARRPAWGGAATRARLESRHEEQREEETDEKKFEWLADIVHKYLLKLRQEREARLEGRIVAADFYVRQLTWIEVALDLMGSGGGLELLCEFRKDDHHVIHIAETPFSRILDEARREKWAELGEPLRPEHPPRDYLVDYDGFSVEADKPGVGQTWAEQRAAEEADYKKQAEALVIWEAEASEAAAAWSARVEAEAEARRDQGAGAIAPPYLDGEPGSAGQPAPPGDRTDVTNSVRDGPPTPVEEAPNAAANRPETPDEQ